MISEGPLDPRTGYDADAATVADQRARLRSRRLKSGVVATLIGRGATALVPLVLIPIMLNYLGPELFGLWVTISGVTAMALWADFGLGNGLMTKLSACFASSDWAMAKRYVSTAYATLIITMFASCAALWTLSGAIPWHLLDLSGPGSSRTAQTMTLACVTGFLVNIPLALVQRIQFAYQHVVQSNIWQLVGCGLAVFLTWAAVRADAGPVVAITTAALGPVIANLTNTIVVFRGFGSKLRPHLRAIEPSSALSMVKVGALFLVLSIITAAALNADSLIIARAAGFVEVTNFSVPYKVFTVLALFVTLVNLPLWPANAEALARHDYEWVRRLTTRMTVISVAGVLAGGAFMAVVAPGFLSAWLAVDVRGGRALFVALGIWWLVVASAAPRFMVQNSVANLSPQLVGWSLYLALSIPLKWWSVHHFGLVGIPIVASVLYITILWPTAAIGYRTTIASCTAARDLGTDNTVARS